MARYEDIATTCDECSKDINYGDPAYSHPTGEKAGEVPIVRIVCRACHFKILSTPGT